MTEHRNTWRKSSYSSNGAQCVEVRTDESVAFVRDTKHRAGGMLAFPAAAWAAFLGAGERRA